MLRIFTLLFGLCWLHVPDSAACPAAPAGAPPDSMHLALRERAGLRLEIVVRNQGSQPIHWIRPPADEPARFARWGGWHLQLKGAGKTWKPFTFPAGVTPVDASHCMVLAPGAAVILEWSLAHWIAEGMPEKDAPRLSDARGRFDLQVSYEPPGQVYAGPDRMLERGREITPLTKSEARLERVR